MGFLIGVRSRPVLGATNSLLDERHEYTSGTGEDLKEQKNKLKSF